MNAFPNILAAAEQGTIEKIVTEFGVSWNLFIPQVISFLIVAILLKKFAFGPIQEMLNQRSARIAEGEEKLKRIEQQLANSEKETQEAIDKANAEAQRLITEAQENATILTEKKAQEAVNSAQHILAKAQEAAKAEQQAMRSELKQEFGRLIASTTATVTGKVLNEEDKKRINEEALTSVEA